MNKKLLTALCILTLLVGMLAIGATASETSYVAFIGSEGYTDLQTAVNEATGTDVIKLEQNVTTMTVNKDVYVDLNGKNIVTLTVNGGAFYGLDSQTDDYDIDADNHTGYGKIGTINNIDGKVTGAPVDVLPTEDTDTYPNGFKDGYLMVTEDGYGTSFHRINLQIYTMKLKAETVGLYYKSKFGGDALVAANVAKYGIACSIVEEPTAANLDEKCKLSSFTGFVAGENAGENTSTLISGVMRETNPSLINNRNANMAVYGRAYILTKDNQYLLGSCQSRNLKKQVELASEDRYWNGYTAPQKEEIAAMYKKYVSVMSNWDVSNIESAVVVNKNAPISPNKGTLKLLAITSSFGKNTTQLLYDIAIAQGYENVTVARLYGSGATLANHVTNATSNTSFYEYTKISNATNGQWSTVYNEGESGATIQYGLLDEDWDVIFIQQSAAHSPQLRFYNTYIDQLMVYIKGIIGEDTDTQFIWNMTWAYQKDSTDIYVFPKFNRDQMRMYEANVDVVQKKLVPRTDFAAIIPTGTAIQTARTSVFGDALTYDGMHLNNLGKVIAGYTLYSTLTGEELTTINLNQVTKEMSGQNIPEIDQLTEQEKLIIMETVNNAIANPFHVTQSAYTN